MFSKHFNFCQRWPLWGFENCPATITPTYPILLFVKLCLDKKAIENRNLSTKWLFAKKETFLYPHKTNSTIDVLNFTRNRCIAFNSKSRSFQWCQMNNGRKKNHFLIKLNHISHFKSSISNFKLTPFVIIYVFSCAHPLSFCFSVYC